MRRMTRGSARIEIEVTEQRRRACFLESETVRAAPRDRRRGGVGRRRFERRRARDTGDQSCRTGRRRSAPILERNSMRSVAHLRQIAGDAAVVANERPLVGLGRLRRWCSG